MDNKYSYREWLFWEPYVVALLSTLVLYFSWFTFDEGADAISVSLLSIIENMGANFYILKFFSNDIETIGYVLMAAVALITVTEIIYVILKIAKKEKIAKKVCFAGGIFNLILSMSILVRYVYLIEFDGFIGMGIYIKLTFMPIFTFMMSCWQLLIALPKPKWL